MAEKAYVETLSADTDTGQSLLIRRYRLCMPLTHIAHHTQQEPQRNRTFWLTAAGSLLLLGLTACGPGSADNASRNDSRGPANGIAAQATDRGGKISPAPLTSNNGTASASVTDNQPGGSPSTNANVLNGEMDGRTKVPVPGLPDTIAKDLNSPDARVRYRALDHWEKAGTKTPLDPVFEALEDQDEAVRAKATAIVEQYWSVEQKRAKEQSDSQGG